MNRFAIVTPSDLPHASKLLAQRGNLALAGGIDTIDLLKQDILEPRTLVNLKGLNGNDAIESDGAGGLRIGTMVKLHEIANHPELGRAYPAVAEAAANAATPQIRNLATAGGNLLQRPRCWYFRNPDVDCLKKGGLKCYAENGLNRYHAIFGGGPSYIVHPSNLAPALIAYGASVRIFNSSGYRIVELEKFFILPKVDPLRENVLQPGDIITDIILPAPATGAGGAYLEAREKQSFDWPLVSVAAVLATSNSRRVNQARIVMGAVAPIPWRVPEAEKAITGVTLDSASAARAGEIAVAGATALADNRYKIPIARALVRRALLKAGGVEEGI